MTWLNTSTMANTTIRYMNGSSAYSQTSTGNTGTLDTSVWALSTSPSIPTPYSLRAGLSASYRNLPYDNRSWAMVEDYNVANITTGMEVLSLSRVFGPRSTAIYWQEHEGDHIHPLVINGRANTNYKYLCAECGDTHFEDDDQSTCSNHQLFNWDILEDEDAILDCDYCHSGGSATNLYDACIVRQADSKVWKLWCGGCPDFCNPCRHHVTECKCDMYTYCEIDDGCECRECEGTYQAADADLFVECACCNTRVRRDASITYVSDIGMMHVCHTCQFSVRRRSFTCSACEDTFIGHSHTIEDYNEEYDEYENHTYCVTCFLSENICAQCSRRYDGDECPRCDGVLAWNYVNPSLMFLNTPKDTTKTPYLGIEIEVEAQKHGATRKGGAKMVRDMEWAGRVMWCMHDGSLLNSGQGGFEIVTHPMTYNYIRTHADYWRNFLSTLVAYGMRSWDGKRCGMHIHITRTGMTKAHQLRFINFFYGSTNLSMAIGGRRYSDPTMQQYAPFDKEDRAQFYSGKVLGYSNPGARSHYAAINTMKHDTIEARWFRGTLNYESFMKNVEFIQSVWDFTRLGGNTKSNEMNYMFYLQDRKTQYPNVYNFINEHYLERTK